MRGPKPHIPVVIALLLLVLPAHAEVSNDGLTPEERQALDAALASDAESDTAAAPEPSTFAAILQSMNPDIALVLDTALAWFSEDPLQAGAHDPNRTGFTLQQLELTIGASVDPFFRLDTYIVFAEFGVEVEEAYATTLDLPAGLQLRGGLFLTPIGRLNATHPHSWDFIDQPLVNGKFLGGEGSRGLGLEFSWLTPMPWYVQLTAAANQAEGACCARSFFGADDPGVEGPEDLLYTLVLDQFFELGRDWSLAWGLSAQLGPNSTGQGNRTDIYATDLYLYYRPLDHAGRTHVALTVEAMLRARQVPDDRLVDWGLYSQLVWLIDQRWEVGARHDYVSGVADDPLDPQEDSERHRVALQGTFYPSHFSRVRLQGAWDRPTWREEPIWSAMLGLEVLIGTHGAHSF